LWKRRLPCGLWPYDPYEGRLPIVFAIETCEERKIGLVRFYGELTEADFEGLDVAARAVKDAPAYDVIYDMSGVEDEHLAVDFVSKRGKLPQANPSRQRLYVVPKTTSSCWCGSMRRIRLRPVGLSPSSSAPYRKPSIGCRSDHPTSNPILSNANR